MSNDYCACGCGTEVSETATGAKGHNRKGTYGAANGNGRGGRVFKKGYIMRNVHPDHPLAAKANRDGDSFGVPEHRLVMHALTHMYFPGEDRFVVHHRDYNKANNKKENLVLFKNAGDHTRFHHLMRNEYLEHEALGHIDPRDWFTTDMDLFSKATWFYLLEHEPYIEE